MRKRPSRLALLLYVCVLALATARVATAAPPPQLAPLPVILTQSPSPQGIVLTATIPEPYSGVFDPLLSIISIGGVPVGAGTRPVTYLNPRQISTVLLPTDVGQIVVVVGVGGTGFVSQPQTITVGQFGPTPTGVAFPTPTSTPSATGTATPTPVVPEGSPLWLFGSGLLLLGGFAYQSRRRRPTAH